MTSATSIKEIEKYCKRNAWDEWGFNSLNASSINAWSSNPARWIADKLLGLTDKFQPTVSMARGRAVLHGAAHYLYKRNEKEAIRAALTAYENGVVEFTDENEINAEWSLIEPMIRGVITRLVGYPSLMCRNVAASTHIEGIHIPITSWAGFVFHDRVLEIKTSKKLPSEISAADAKMLAIDSITRNDLPAEIIYATGKKTAHFRLNDYQKGEAIEELIQDALSLQTMLETFDDGTKALKLYPINPKNWTWKEGEVEKINKELGYNGKNETPQNEQLSAPPSGSSARIAIQDSGHWDAGDDIPRES